MRNLFTSIMILFLLAACGTSTPQTSEVSPLSGASEVSATSTPTTTATPTASVTPTPTVPAEYAEVYKYLDKSFVLETGAANAEGVREIMTTNQLGEKVTVATVDASGNVMIDDVLKYKPVGFDEMPPQGEAISQLPTLEQVQQGLFRDNTLLNAEISEFDADTVLPDGLARDGKLYIYNGNFTPDPSKPLFEVLSGYYFRNEDGSVMPALIVAWYRGTGKKPAIITTIYREKETLAGVMNAVNSGGYDPLPYNTVGNSIYYLYNGKPTSRINPLTVIAQTPIYVDAYDAWAEDGIPPEFASNNAPLLLVGRIPKR